ncbi:MAG TPA: alpha/beta hydrolase [Beijerinckiaceae bacterium]|nr:alpha/beta hydrolase [Beijerinckiaceae bacterium]
MADYADLFVSAADGLRLFARDYGPRTGTALAIVCLPGLARTSADFHELALSLSQDGKRSRRVLALDYRGRGRSEYDRDWRNYDVKVELADVLAVLTAASIEEAIFVGTSRGGLLTMALSAARPALLRGAVLNDIGPVIEGRGLARIRGYVGKLPAPADYGEAVDMLKKLMSAQFTALSEEEWRSWAEATWKEENGRLVTDYDPALARTLESIDLEAPLAPFWFLFEGLKRVPVLALRGANSDLLSAETFAAMGRAHRDLRRSSCRARAMRRCSRAAASSSRSNASSCASRAGLDGGGAYSASVSSTLRVLISAEAAHPAGAFRPVLCRMSSAACA